MALPKTETFTTDTSDKALATYDANWVVKQGGYIVRQATDVCECNGTAEGEYAAWTGDTFNADQYSKGTLKSAGGGNFMGVAVRIPSSGDGGYYFFANAGGTDSYFGYFDATGTPNDIGANRGAFAVNDVIEIQVTGTTFSLRKNGSEIASVSDSTYSSGYAGISSYQGNTLQIDDVEMGNMGGGPTPLTFEGTDNLNA